MWPWLLTLKAIFQLLDKKIVYNRKVDLDLWLQTIFKFELCYIKLVAACRVCLPEDKPLQHGCLTLSLPIPLRLYTLPYWSNPPILIFDIQVLWHSVLSALALRLSARACQCQKFINGGIDQYGAEPFQQQQFGTAGVEGVQYSKTRVNIYEIKWEIYLQLQNFNREST